MNAPNSYPTVFSKRFQTLARWVVVIVLWLIIGSIAIGKAGISNFMELLNEKDVLNQTIMEIQIQNQNLEEQIANLKSSPEKQARYLKENFGYIEQDEYIFQFNNKNPFELGKKEKLTEKNTMLSAEADL